MTTAWPSGARCAVAFTFDFDAEEVWLAGDPEAASKPGLLSMGTYGANVGVPELLRLLDRRGIPATFFVPGRVAETHPDRVRDIVAAGLTLLDVVEPEWPPEHEAAWAQWSPLRGRLMPGTAIFVASKQNIALKSPIR